MSQRLSSDNLFHFTKNADTLSKIINSGLRYSYLDESVSSKLYAKYLFNISFCDIKFKDSTTHRKCYGNNAIVLSKEWGMKNGISPVRYVHSNSTGLSDLYVSLREQYNYAIQLPENFDEFYWITTIMSIDEMVNLKDLKSQVKSDYFKNKYNEIKNAYNIIKSILKEHDSLYNTFLETIIHKLIYRINDLHKELIERDNFTRLYEDDFKCPNSGVKYKKVLYDEREWRSIKIFGIDEDNSREQIKEVDKYIAQGFLPPKDNLRFCENDVVAIITEDEKAKNLILQKTNDLNCLLSMEFIGRKIFTISDFDEE
jgi:hypothetical protein